MHMKTNPSKKQLTTGTTGERSKIKNNKLKTKPL